VLSTRAANDSRRVDAFASPLPEATTENVAGCSARTVSKSFTTMLDVGVVDTPTAWATSTRSNPDTVSAVVCRRARMVDGVVAAPEASTLAAAPATNGEAIDVPDMNPHDPLAVVEYRNQPGANTLTGEPKLENDARVSEFVDAATVMTLS